MAGGAVVPISQDEGRGYQYSGRTTFYVICVVIVAASGGLLFGYDLGVTGGVIGMPDFQARFFPETINAPGGDAYCKFDDQLLQLFTSSFFIAGALSALVAMWTSSHKGRKVTMMISGVAFLIGAILTAAAYHIAQLVIGRIILGIGVGMGNQVVPLYLSEMAPFRLRGALNLAFQMAVTLGIFGAQLINYGTQFIEQGWGWRISLAIAGVLAIVFFLGGVFLPDTPNSLIERGRLEEGRRVLQRIRGVKDVDVELEDIQEAVLISNNIRNPYTTIVKRRYWPQLTIIVWIPIFQQFTGINAIMFYAPQLFSTLGSGTQGALLNTVIIGAVNVVATVVAIVLVDRVGRKLLFIQGGVQMIVCEVIVGSLILASIGREGTGVATGPMAAATIAFICLYVAAFAWSWGPLGWLVPSEVSPLEIRSAGTAINTSINFIFSFVIGQCFLTMLCTMKFGVFYFFAGMVFLMTLFVIFLVPETRRVPIEEVEEVRIGRHWFWRRVVAGTRPPVAAKPGPDGIIHLSMKSTTGDELHLEIPAAGSFKDGEATGDVERVGSVGRRYHSTTSPAGAARGDGGFE